MSGKFEVRSSSLLEYSLTESFPMCACTRMPSYLYSMAQRPPILSTIWDTDGRRSASMTFTGLSTETRIPLTASMPPSAMVSATSPMSQVTLKARSISGRSSLVANASASASRMVMSAAPTRILPVTVLHRYLASRGPESWSRLARVFIFLSWESFPSASCIAVRPFTTLSTVSSSEKSVICFFFEIRVSATLPGSPVSIHSLSVSASDVPEVNDIALRTSLSAIPRTPGTKSGCSLPWLR